MATFNWNKEQETLGEKIKKWFYPDKEPLEKKTIMAQYKLKTAIARVSNYVDRLNERDRELFNQVVEALMKRDERRAKIYAKEVAEIRKVAKQLLTVQYALEHAALKLETFLIYGGAVNEVMPVIGVMKQALGILKSVAPDVWIDLQYAVRELESAMGSSIVDVAADIDAGLDSEARKIFEEARVIAEQKVKERFAELPKGVAVPETAESKGTGP
ncbi:MAG: Snf7 family protein [Desulfurococcaceae archaeon]